MTLRARWIRFTIWFWTRAVQLLPRVVVFYVLIRVLTEPIGEMSSDDWGEMPIAR
ncbi:unnamed protein product [marine sediment metagenome]|uniref:Uncharacterized protein n=1 Tax=marine sediment metagenome TaxID=412755 RepID=X1LGK6_9ZZZZ